jgi:hypothetical protein
MPAVPVHTEGPVLTIESCINKPTDAAKETKETTYAKKSQSFNLQLREGLGSPKAKWKVKPFPSRNHRMKQMWQWLEEIHNYFKKR